jgi:hypothetical protein
VPHKIYQRAMLVMGVAVINKSDGNKMTNISYFPFCYRRAMLLSSFLFGFTHGVVELFFGESNSYDLSKIYLSAVIMLILYELLTSIVFFIIGYLISYFPSLIIFKISKRKFEKKPYIYILFGAIMGLVFLPICAAFSYFFLPLPDAPSYLARCAEFVCPMVVAGASGGYAFWRCDRSKTDDAKQLIDLFS